MLMHFVVCAALYKLFFVLLLSYLGDCDLPVARRERKKNAFLKETNAAMPTMEHRSDRCFRPVRPSFYLCKTLLYVQQVFLWARAQHSIAVDTERSLCRTSESLLGDPSTPNPKKKLPAAVATAVPMEDTGCLLRQKTSNRFRVAFTVASSVVSFDCRPPAYLNGHALEVMNEDLQNFDSKQRVKAQKKTQRASVKQAISISTACRSELKKTHVTVHTIVWRHNKVKSNQKLALMERSTLFNESKENKGQQHVVSSKHSDNTRIKHEKAEIESKAQQLLQQQVWFFLKGREAHIRYYLESRFVRQPVSSNFRTWVLVSVADFEQTMCLTSHPQFHCWLWKSDCANTFQHWFEE